MHLHIEVHTFVICKYLHMLHIDMFVSLLNIVVIESARRPPFSCFLPKYVRLRQVTHMYRLYGIVYIAYYSMVSKCFHNLSGWWFGTFFIFPYIRNNHPNWLIFFKGVAQPPSRFFPPFRVSLKLHGFPRKSRRSIRCQATSPSMTLTRWPRSKWQTSRHGICWDLLGFSMI